MHENNRECNFMINVEKEETKRPKKNTLHQDESFLTIMNP